jgi:hypothetical protein
MVGSMIQCYFSDLLGIFPHLKKFTNVNVECNIFSIVLDEVKIQEFWIFQQASIVRRAVEVNQASPTCTIEQPPSSTPRPRIALDKSGKDD